MAIGQHGGFGSVIGLRAATPREAPAPANETEEFDETDLAPASARAARTRMTPESEARFRAMIDAQFDFIWRSLRGLGVPSAGADDAAQQVFLIAAQKLEQIAVRSERSFLFSTARGIAANLRRSRARSREIFDEDARGEREPASGALDPEQEAARSQARALLEKILEGLSLDLRTVFVLFELEGMSTAQMAEMLDVPMGTVASRLRRAREEFQAAAKRFHATRGGHT